MKENIPLIADKFKEIMELMGIDLTIDGREKTPLRVAKMYVEELFSGLNKENKPKIMVQENHGYDQMIIESNISIISVCEHHFAPIIGYAHIAYIPDDYLIGLSKLNRIAQFIAKQPQVQERLTNDISTYLMSALKTNDVAVTIDAAHFCVKMRGVKDHCSVTRTNSLYGVFRDSKVRSEFFQAIPKMNDLKI